MALTTTSHSGDEYRTPQVMLSIPYVSAIEGFGGAPLLITPEHGLDSIRRLMALADGLVLTGGEDVDPAFYGEDPHPELGPVHRGRDEMEFAALDIALERRIPVLAICRGIQLLNVAFGGTLYQDLPSQRGGPILHEQSAPISHRWHTAEVEEGSRLHEIFGEGRLFINSFHHQGIRTLADGLTARVWAEDGLIEAVEASSHPWVIGVQWHPERGEAERPGDPVHPDRRLFQAFLDAIRGSD